MRNIIVFLLLSSLLLACTSRSARTVNHLTRHEHPPVIALSPDEETANFVVIISNQSGAISEWPFRLTLSHGERDDVIAQGVVLSGYHDQVIVPYRIEPDHYTLHITCTTGNNDYGSRSIAFVASDKVVISISTYCSFDDGTISPGHPLITVERRDEVPGIF